MGSHQDMDHGERRRIIEELRLKSELMTELGANRTTADGDVLEESEVDGLRVQKKPDDERGVLRISIGGHPAIERSSYCNFRGDRRACIELLERALYAMKQEPECARTSK